MVPKLVYNKITKSKATDVIACTGIIQTEKKGKRIASMQTLSWIIFLVKCCKL